MDPNPVLQGPSETEGGIPTNSKDCMEVEQSPHEIEELASVARIFGGPPTDSTAGVAIKETNRYAQYIEGMLKTTRDKLHSGSLPQTADYSKSDAERKTELSSNRSFKEVSEEANGPTPNEAWITKSLQKFQIYARRVVQFFIFNISGSGLEEQLAQLRQANIQTILIKYKSLLSGAGWTSCFLPAAFLDLACRVEINPALLTIDSHREFQIMEKAIHD